MRRLAVLGALAACLSLPPTAVPYATHPGLDEVESWLAHRPVQVRCFNEAESAKDSTIGGGASAYVNIRADGFGPENFTVFAWPLCKILLDMSWDVNEWRWRWEDRVWAVLVITHEAGHLKGSSFPYWRSERQVNIWALKRAFAVAHLKFNVPFSQKREFNRAAIAIYLAQPPAYNGGKCVSPFLDEADDVRCAR